MGDETSTQSKKKQQKNASANAWYYFACDVNSYMFFVMIHIKVNLNGIQTIATKKLCAKKAAVATATTEVYKMICNALSSIAIDGMNDRRNRCTILNSFIHIFKKQQ